MGRFLSILLAALWTMSCHINEVAEEILELELDDSLKTCARLDIVVTNPAGTVLIERIWDAAPPDPLVIRHTFKEARVTDFLVKVACVDGGSVEVVRTIKTIPYRGGARGPVHVVHGPEARYRIAAFKLMDSADADGDGFFRAYRTVLDVDANTNFDTLRVSIAYQVQGNTKWFPLIPSRYLPIAGAVADDTLILATEGGARRIISLKAEIRTAGGDSLDAALIAGVREETPWQDSAGLRWVFRNHTGAVLALTAEVGPERLSNRRVAQDDSVVVRLSSKSPDENLRYAAVAQGPGEPLEWDAESPMEMDGFDVVAEAAPSDSHFVLNLLNRSGQAISAIILNPGTPNERSYAADLPGLPGSRNLGLFPYVTGATIAFRFDGGATRAFNSVVFATHPVFGYRHADITLDDP